MWSSQLLALADSRFPSGAHAQSAGVESAVAVGDVIDTSTLGRYLQGRLTTTGAVDAAFAAAVCSLDDDVGAEPGERRRRVAVLDSEYDARILSPRLRSVDRRQGRQLLRTVRAAWTHRALDDVGHPEGPHQALVWGAAVAAVGGAPADAARLVLHHLTGAVVTSAVRLLGLDPFAVVDVQVRAMPLVDRLVSEAVTAAEGAPGSLPARGGALTEILGEHHGAWPARLFVA